MDASTHSVSPLRQRMIDDMCMRRMQDRTQEAYIRGVRRLARFMGRSPEAATAEDLRRFQLHLVQAGVSRWRIAGGTYTVQYAAAAIAAGYAYDALVAWRKCVHFDDDVVTIASLAFLFAVFAISLFIWLRRREKSREAAGYGRGSSLVTELIIISGVCAAGIALRLMG